MNKFFEKCVVLLIIDFSSGRLESLLTSQDRFSMFKRLASSSVPIFVITQRKTSMFRFHHIKAIAESKSALSHKNSFLNKMPLSAESSE